MPYADLAIADDWYVSGLCGTGSRTIIAEDLFVPEHRVLPMSEAQSGRHRSERHAADPYYRAPIGAVANANSAGTPLGLGQAALERFLEQLPGRGITLTSHTDRRLAAITHLQVGEAAVKLESAAFHAIRCAEIVDERCQGEQPFTIRDRAQIRSDLGYVTDLARGVAHLLLEGSGPARSTKRCRSSASSATSTRSPNTPCCTPRPTSSCTGAYCAASSPTRSRSDRTAEVPCQQIPSQPTTTPSARSDWRSPADPSAT